jgi:hypothetical protein
MSELSQILTSEEKLLISLCRMEFSSDQKIMIRDQMEAVNDWNYFVEMANEHGIIALCWYNIIESGNSKSIPAEFLEKLHSGYLKSLTRNTFLYNLFEEIITLAKRDKIKVVMLKGLALEKTIYRNMGLRQMNDMDILVKPEQAINLRELLLNNGFDSTPLISTLYKKNMFSDGKHLPEMYKDGVAVEIHFKLFRETGYLLTEELLDKAQSIPGEEDQIYPEPQMHFLYLVKHLDNHENEGSSQLRLYADLVVLLDLHYDKIINEKLFNDAVKSDMENALKEKLKLLEIFGAISFPEWVNDLISEINSETIKEKFIRFLRNPFDNSQIKEAYNPLVPLKYVPGIKNKILFVTGYICPSMKYMKIKYNTKTRTGTILYYPVRWIHIVEWLTGIRGKV